MATESPEAMNHPRLGRRLSDGRRHSIEGVDVSHLYAVGRGLSEGVAGEESEFVVRGPSKGEGLAFTIEGPSKPIFETLTNKDGSILVTYTPRNPGQYKVSVYSYGKQINGSPWVVNVTGEAPKVNLLDAIPKIRVFGKALELGHAGTQNEVDIDCRKASEIKGTDISVSMKNPPRSSSMIKLHDNLDGTYIVTYKPTIAGTYVLNIKVEDVHVPGSPWKINVRP